MRFLFLVLACAWPASWLRAQAVVTESDVLVGLDERHPAVRALLEDLGRAEAARRQATTLANPRVELAREQPEGNPRQTTWTASWTPPLDGRLGLARGAADAGLSAARARLDMARMRLRREVRTAYADWLLALERRDLVGGQEPLVRLLAEAARRRAEAGEESGLSARRLELAAAELTAALGIAEADVLRSHAVLGQWRPELPPDARPTRTDLPEPPLDHDPGSRPDVQALRFEARQAEMERRLSRRFLGFPELQAGWQQLDQAGATQRGLVFGLSWSLPLFDRSQGRRVEADRRRDAAEARLTLGERRAEAEWTAFRASYARLREAARHARASVADTGRIVDGAVAAFRAGEAGVTDLLETLRAVRDARLRETETYGLALEAHRDLEIAAGKPLLEGGSR